MSLYGGLGVLTLVGSRGKTPGGDQGAKPPDADFYVIQLKKFDEK
jgi:hypothetical protein